MPPRITTRRWNDPPIVGEGTRILVTRYRPRGLAKADETWDEWHSVLGPSTALHAAVYGKLGPPITFETYAQRYIEEMKGTRAQFFLGALRDRIADGESVSLLCSSACVDEARCHRGLLRKLLIEPTAG